MLHLAFLFCFFNIISISILAFGSSTSLSESIQCCIYVVRSWRDHTMFGLHTFNTSEKFSSIFFNVCFARAFLLWCISDQKRLHFYHPMIFNAFDTFCFYGTEVGGLSITVKLSAFSVCLMTIIILKSSRLYFFRSRYKNNKLIWICWIDTCPSSTNC